MALDINGANVSLGEDTYSLPADPETLNFSNINPTGTTGGSPNFSLGPQYVFEMKFNQVVYEAEIWLDNGAGEGKGKTGINPNAIVNLTINDTLATWSTGGTLTMLYNPEGATRGDFTIGGQELENADLLADNYVFRNDGRDILRVRLVPKINKTGDSYDADEKLWTLSYVFSIYDREEIELPQGGQNAAGNAIKAVKLYFWDSWYQKLSTRVIEYSTALSNSVEVDTELDNGVTANNEGMVLYTGDALKEIIETGLSPSGTQGGNLNISEDIKGGTGPDNVIGDPWDKGAAKIFYTSPAGTTALESMMYVYNKHISSTDSNDFCLLRREKSQNAEYTGQFVLVPVKDVFAKAGSGEKAPGEYQIEHFVFHDYTDSLNATLKAPLGNGNDRDISTAGFSSIQNYRFVDIASVINEKEFCSRPVHSFNFRKRSFNIEWTKNSIETARSFMSDNYINQLYKSGSGNDLFLINLNEDKKNLNVKPVFSNDGDNPNIRQSAGLQKLLKHGIFQNACITFRAYGLSFRQSGRFIGIDKAQGVESGEFPDKFFGQWFIIDIKHVFEAGLYYNDITAIKVHRFEKSPLNIPGTI